MRRRRCPIVRPWIRRQASCEAWNWAVLYRKLRMRAQLPPEKQSKNRSVFVLVRPGAASGAPGLRIFVALGLLEAFERLGARTRRGAVGLSFGLFGGLVGCVPIDGGAVELSWVIRTPDGRAVGSCGCAEPEIARVRIRLTGTGAQEGQRPCANREDCAFPCGSGTGATGFSIPPGDYFVEVVPEGQGGEDLRNPATGARVQVPASILRSVSSGKTTQLDAYLLQARCRDSCNGGDAREACVP